MSLVKRDLLTLIWRYCILAVYSVLQKSFSLQTLISFVRYLTLVITKSDLTTRKQPQNNLKLFDYLAAPTKAATGYLKRLNHIKVGRHHV